MRDRNLKTPTLSPEKLLRASLSSVQLRFESNFAFALVLLKYVPLNQ